jgi:hypothetical protein
LSFFNSFEHGRSRRLIVADSERQIAEESTDSVRLTQKAIFSSLSLAHTLLHLTTYRKETNQDLILSLRNKNWAARRRPLHRRLCVVVLLHLLLVVSVPVAALSVLLRCVLVLPLQWVVVPVLLLLRL